MQQPYIKEVRHDQQEDAGSEGDLGYAEVRLQHLPHPPQVPVTRT